MSKTVQLLYALNHDKVVKLRFRHRQRRRIIAAFAIFLAVLLGNFAWTMSQPTVEARSTLLPPASHVNAPDQRTDSGYYPAHYVNQATSQPVEPIPTF